MRARTRFGLLGLPSVLRLPGMTHRVRKLRVGLAAALIGLLLTGLTGCKKEKAPDQPTVIGVPPATAYLGVEYYYNFGAYGGDKILDYSLTNAPAWVGLEDTANKARPGVILRGVPGVTGGGRGAADLGNNRNINLTTTDGTRLGVQPFDIEVKENKVTLAAAKFREGTASDVVEGAGEDEKCAMPDMAGRGQHEISYNTYADDGSGETPEKKATLYTYPVLVKVLLDQPSVQTSKIAFELRSEYDPSACDSGTPPDQDCEFSKRNIDEAQLGKDVVVSGSKNGNRLPQPEYIDVTSETSGVITLERGITECYIRLEIVDDKFIEANEAFDIALTEVRQGLVSLGNDGDAVTKQLTIADNSPTVSFESLEGHNASAMNEGDTRTFKAVLDRGDAPLDEPFKARLYNDPETATADEDDFTFKIPNDDPAATPDNQFVEGRELVFGANVTSVNFQVEANDDSGSPPTSENPAGDGPDNDDEFLDITVDTSYQYGRAGYAAKGANLKLWLNELKQPLIVGDSASNLIPTDMVVGDNGRIFVASNFLDSSSRHFARIEIFNRFGVSPPEQTILIPTNGTIDPEPRLAFTERTTQAGSEERVIRGLGVGFRTNGAIEGNTNSGGVDSAIYYFRRVTGDPGYQELWHAQYGTSGDDKPLKLALNGSDSVFVGGDTTGVWSGETRGGGTDIYVQRIDSVTKDGKTSAELGWVSQQGSAAEEALFGLGAISLTGYGVGTTLGQVSAETALGGKDLFLTKYAGSKAAPPELFQFGTARNDTLTDAYVNANATWALGTSDFGYSRTIDEDEYEAVLELDDTTRTSQGHILVYTLSGEFNSAINLNDTGDSASDLFTNLTPFDGDFIAGGKTDGEFVKDSAVGGLILARVERNQEIILEYPESEDDEEVKEPIEHPFNNLEEAGRYQYPSLGNSASLIKLGAYENAEITALVSHDGIYEILIFNGDGEWLNQ